ncbi:MAG: hypothetical protein KC462_06195, partial [Cyanobacteria bacterium HKST-UBA05]|nr:hypothetical protein [Cyanobacteria bacterium HKST-UBA05]
MATYPLPCTPAPAYEYAFQDPQATMTLAEGIAEFYQRHPNRIYVAREHRHKLFLNAHDALHVLFGCPPTFEGEWRLAWWTMLATDFELLLYPRLAISRRVQTTIVKGGLVNASLAFFGSLGELAAIVWRS